MGQRWLRRSSAQAGASAVEFAIVLPLLVMLVFGVVHFGLAYNRQQSFHAASREAGRLLAVGYELDEIEGRVRQVAGATVDEQHVDIIVLDECDGADDPDYVEVAVRLSSEAGTRYQIAIPLVPTSNPDFESVATFRCEVQP